MRITLINPMQGGPSFLNMGLAYLLSSIEKKHQAVLLDLAIHLRDYKSYMIDKLEKDIPDVIGCSANSFTFKECLDVAGIIKKKYPHIPFIFGGIHPTLFPEETLASPLVDAVCIGEGEKTIVEYLDKLEQGKNPDVDGIWYKSKNGEIIKNKLRPFNEDLDGIPFPGKHYFDLDKYLKWLPWRGCLSYIASRGCPFNCTFCSSPVIRKTLPGRYHRLRNPEKIIEEIKQDETRYSKNGFKYVSFGDDTFGLNLEYFRQFCNLYKESGLHHKLGWTCVTRASIVTEEWAKLASKSGCVSVALGVESGDEYIRNEIYKKNITDEQILKANQILNKNGVKSAFYMIIGFPQETRRAIRASFSLLRKAKPLLAGWSPYMQLPKTDLALQAEKEIYLAHTKEFDEYNKLQPRKLLSIGFRDYLNISFGYIKQFVTLRNLHIPVDIIKYICSFVSTFRRYYPFKEFARGRILKGYLYSEYMLSLIKNNIEKSRSFRQYY